MKTKDLDALISYTEEATDHYAEHLAEVNKETDVVATEDIYNKSGVLVARRNARIDHGAAKRLVQHKLLRPIEEQGGRGGGRGGRGGGRAGGRGGGGGPD